MFFYTEGVPQSVFKTRLSSHEEDGKTVLCFDIRYASSTPIGVIVPIAGNIILASTFDAKDTGSNYNYLDTITLHPELISPLPNVVNTIRKFVIVKEPANYRSILDQSGFIKPPSSMTSIIFSMYPGYQFLFCQLQPTLDGFTSVMKVVYESVNIFSGITKYRLIPIATNLTDLNIDAGHMVIPDRRRLATDPMVIFREVPSSYNNAILARRCLYTSNDIHYSSVSLGTPRIFGDVMVPVVTTGRESTFLIANHLNEDISQGHLNLTT